MWCKPEDHLFFQSIHSARYQLFYSSFFSNHPGNTLLCGIQFRTPTSNDDLCHCFCLILILCCSVWIAWFPELGSGQCGLGHITAKYLVKTPFLPATGQRFSYLSWHRNRTANSLFVFFCVHRLFFDKKEPTALPLFFKEQREWIALDKSDLLSSPFFIWVRRAMKNDSLSSVFIKSKVKK